MVLPRTPAPAPMTRTSLLGSALLCVALGGLTFAQVDISVSQIGEDSGSDSYVYWGKDSGIRAYSVATTACNVGSVHANWNDAIAQAPIIATNLFRITPDGAFEQMGYSYVKYSFCALDEDGSGCPNGCQPEGCDWLGVGCSDTYWAALNDGQVGGSKWLIDPVTGQWPASKGGPTSGPPAIRGRLQVHNSDIQEAGSLFFSEGQYLHQEDHAAGNARDNYAWRPIEFNPGPTKIRNIGPTQMGDPAIYAWQANVNGVLIHDLAVEDEGGVGIHGWIFVGSHAVDLGGGLWRYQYAIQNGNSGRAVGSFDVPLPCDGVTISDVYWHGVDHHSGSPWKNDPWTQTQPAGSIHWESVPWSTDVDANAIRWGTTYTFAFTADRAPGGGTASVGLFVPGTPSSLSAQVIAPGPLFPNYCTANANSTGQAAHISATGGARVSDNDLVLTGSQLPPNQFGYFLMSQSTAFIPGFGGSSGNLCLGAPQIRFSGNVLNSGSVGQVTLAIDNQNLPGGVVFQPGDTWFFQLWYRDLGPTSNTTEGVQVDFCN